jgi:hypothetical protein
MRQGWPLGDWRASGGIPHFPRNRGRNGAATYDKNTGAVLTSQPQNSNQVAPGANIQGWRGHIATKAVTPGCGFVNGTRVCN